MGVIDEYEKHLNSKGYISVKMNTYSDRVLYKEMEDGSKDRISITYNSYNDMLWISRISPESGRMWIFKGDDSPFDLGDFHWFEDDIEVDFIKFKIMTSSSDYETTKLLNAENFRTELFDKDIIH